MSPSLETIAGAIKLIDSKKESLKAAYDELQLHSSLLSSSVSISWPVVDSHFTAKQKSFSDRLRLLKSLEPSAPSRVAADPVPARTEVVLVPARTEVVPVPARNEVVSQAATRTDSVVCRSELRSLCENMKGGALVKYILDQTGERDGIRRELSTAMAFASNPASMVLDAIEGVGLEDARGMDVASPRLTRVFVLLLEQLMEIDANIGDDMRERAKKIAIDWKLKAGSDSNKHLEALGFLHLVAAYGLGPEFDINELMDYFVSIARYKQAISLGKKIIIGENVADLIQKLLDNSKLVLAAKFVLEFQMTGKFEPVSILNAYLEESKAATQKVCKDGNNSTRALNEAADKEISALMSVIKIAEEHKLESEISKETLEKRIEEIQIKKAERKQPAATAARPQQQQRVNPQPDRQNTNKPRQRGSKRSRMAAATGPHPPRSRPRPAGPLPNLSASYLSSSLGPYSLVNSNHGAVPYPGSSSAGLYGSAVSAGAHLYNPESQTSTPSYYGGQTYAEYGLPTQYHTAYYPQ